MTIVRHRTHKSYSGPVIYGKKIPQDNVRTTSHCQRAVWLTEGVETEHRAGSIMAADGTGMTAGRGQHILVYPKELAHEDFNAKDDQGGLGKLLRRIEVKAPSSSLDILYGAFIAEGWHVASDGRFRWNEDGRVKVKGRWINCKAGDVVHGAVLRDTITPIGGKVPKTGRRWEQAKAWALLFHVVFSEPNSLEVQAAFEVNHLYHRMVSKKFAFRDNRRKETVSQVVYGGRQSKTPIPHLQVGRDISEELDLAMCVFHSHTVNAPAIAFRRLRDTLKATGFNAPRDRGTNKEIVFARELLKRLAKTNYGRWLDSLKTGRWSRTRKTAMKSGLWPMRFFQGSSPIMPVKFS